MFKLLNDLIKYMQKQNLSEKTIIDYMQSLEMFFKDYNINPENFNLLEDPQFIKDYTDELRDKYKPNTINAKMSAVKCFSRFLITEGYIKNSPLLAYKNVRVDKKQVDYFPEEDIKKLMNYFKSKIENPNTHRKVDYLNAKREYIMVLMMITLGLRLEELTEIRLNDVKGVDFNILAVRGKGYNGEVSRHVKMPPGVAALLQEYIKDIRSKIDIKNVDDELYLWISALTHRKVGRRGIQDRLKQAEKELNIGHVHAHKLRHSYATNALLNGMDVNQISDILGHANTNITEQIYIAKGNAVSKDNNVYKNIL